MVSSCSRHGDLLQTVLNSDVAAKVAECLCLVDGLVVPSCSSQGSWLQIAPEWRWCKGWPSLWLVNGRQGV